MADLPADITRLSLPELSGAIRAGKLSCVETMQAFLDRIDRLNPAVNAIVSRRDPEACLADARSADAALSRGDWRGVLHGLPQAPKDLAETTDLPTTLGFRPLAGFHPPQDAIVVERARKTGAILVGKTNTPEFGLGSHSYNRLFGVTGNAYDPARSAGGSSGGAAVALALDLLPGADGSDMMGSLRNPAGWNNVFGLRPSFGRVPYGPMKELFYAQLGTEGPMGRTVEELALLLSVQAGPDARVPLSLSEPGETFARPLARTFKGCRIGWLGDLGGHLPFDPGVLDLCRSALSTFETLGCTVEEARPAFDMDLLWRTWITLRAFLVAGNLRVLYDTPARRAEMKPEAIWEVEQGLVLKAEQVYAATQARSAWYRALSALFERHDFLVLPSAQVFPFDKTQTWPKTVGGRTMDTYHRWMEVVIGPTLAGVPALCVPAGFNPAGLPMGLQIIAPARADFALLQIGHAYEQASTHRLRRPALAG